MLVNVDVKSLEIHTAAFLSQDEVLMKELWEEFDLHTDNQTKFLLPTRTIAKFLIFRILFGGSAGGFYHDPDFLEVGYSKKQWQNVVDAFYAKYRGIAKWHQQLIQTATTTGKLIMPTGREFRFKQYKTDYGDFKWPDTQIKNFPVQSTGADVMTIYRIQVHTMMKMMGLKSKLVSSVHDSLVADCPENEVKVVLKIMFDAAKIVPQLFDEAFGVEYNVPFRIEGSYGPNMNDQEEVSEESLENI